MTLLQLQSIPTIPECYTWTFPGCPVRVELHIEVVERIIQGMKTTAMPGGYGLLIGRTKSPRDIEITDVKPIEEGWASIERAKEMISREREDGEAVVGIYRSTTAKEIRLQKQDLALMRAQFAGPADICLIVNHSEDGSSTAGFFFWDNGNLETAFSFNEFPFEPTRLRAEMLERRLDASETTLTEETTPAQPENSRMFKRLLLIAAASMLLSIAAVFGHRVLIPPPTKPTDEASLALRVDRQGNDWRISWDRNAPILRTNVSGKLTIKDNGGVLREIPLEDEELRYTGSIVYAPTGQRVQFRLEIAGQAVKAIETVLAIRGASPIKRD